MKKLIDKQVQDVSKLYGINRKKKLVLREKQMKAKDEISKIGSGFEEVIAYKANFKDNLEEKSFQEKLMVEEEIEIDIEVRLFHRGLDGRIQI